MQALGDRGRIDGGLGHLVELTDDLRGQALELATARGDQALQCQASLELGLACSAIGDFGRTTPYATGTAKIVLGWAPDFVVTAGDNTYTGGGYDQDVGLFYHSLIGNYQGTHGKGAKTNRFWPSLGNHDHDSAYEAFFTLPGNERYYDFVEGDVHFFMINSNKGEPDGTSPDSVQGQWLKAHLAASTSLYNVG